MEDFAEAAEKLARSATMRRNSPSELAELAQEWGFGFHESWALADWAIAILEQWDDMAA